MVYTDTRCRCVCAGRQTYEFFGLKTFLLLFVGVHCRRLRKESLWCTGAEVHCQEEGTDTCQYLGVALRGNI